jgi:hypothetical protein
MLLDIAATPSPSATDETQILSVPIELRRSGREITMLIDGTDPFATAKPDARLIKLLIRARRFNATLVDSDGVPFAALAKREGVSPSYFTRLVRLSYLAPDITQAILDGRQPRDWAYSIVFIEIIFHPTSRGGPLPSVEGSGWNKRKEKAGGLRPLWVRSGDLFRDARQRRERADRSHSSDEQKRGPRHCH